MRGRRASFDQALAALMTAKGSAISERSERTKRQSAAGFLRGVAAELASGTVELPGLVAARLRVAIHGGPASESPHDAVRTPVLLVHGYGGRNCGMSALRRALLAAGFDSVEAFSYDAFRQRIPAVADDLAAMASRTMAAAGGDRVHLVGYSLGGVIVRYAVQRGRLKHHAASVATIAAPHRGTRVAHLERAGAAADVRPGSALLAMLDAEPPVPAVRWTSYAAELDLVVPPSAAHLDNAAQNVVLRGCGHLPILRSALLARDLARHLRLADPSATPLSVEVGEVALAAGVSAERIAWSAQDSRGRRT